MRWAVIVFLVSLVSAQTNPPVPRLPFDADQAKLLQAQWAKALAVDAEIMNSVGMKLVLIPPGRFDMGPNGSKHRVTLSKPFYIAVTELTLGQYRKFRPG